MSTQPQRNNSGALFANERREKDSHPTHTGSATIDGKEFWVSAWVKEKRSGGRFFSLAFRPKMAREQGAPGNPPAQQPKDDFTDDIPF